MLHGGLEKHPTALGSGSRVEELRVHRLGLDIRNVLDFGFRVQVQFLDLMYASGCTAS